MPAKKRATTKKYKRSEHAVVAVDTVIFSIIDEQLHVLLTQTNKPELTGKWAVPGALVGAEESLENCLKRVLKEKTGLKNVFAEQLATYGDVGRDPFGRVVSVAYMALVHADQQTLATTDEYDAIEWRAVDALPRFAYDHKKLVRDSIERLQGKLAYTNIAHNILAKEFTLTDLQSIYEIILGKALDKRNFRKKILSLGILKKTKKMRSGIKSRPAALYMFADKKSMIVEIL